MKHIYRWILLAAALLLGACSTQHTRTVDSISGVMLGGYDPISYFEKPKPELGDAKRQAKGQYGVYFFTSDDNRKKFEANPKQWEPEFGGHCADGIAYDIKTPGNPLVYEVANSKSRGKKLLMFGGTTAHKYWAIHRAQQWHRAERYWGEGLGDKPTTVHNLYRWTIGRVDHYQTTEQVNAVLKSLGENPPPFCDCE